MMKAGRVAIVPKGDFVNGTEYKRLDMVRYEGGVYVAIKDNVNILPTDKENWMFMIEGSSSVTGVKGSVESDYRTGDVDLLPENIIKRSLIGHPGNSTNKPWFRFASAKRYTYSEDPRITFRVGGQWTNEYVYGILTAHLRLSASSKFPGVASSELSWESFSSSNSINLSNFVLAYKPDIQNSSVDIDLWCKSDIAYMMIEFDVVQEGRSSTADHDIWITYTTVTNDGEAAEIPSDWTRVPSTLMNKKSGNIIIESLSFTNGGYVRSDAPTFLCLGVDNTDPFGTYQVNLLTGSQKPYLGPQNNNTLSLGSSDFKWKDIYAVNGIVATSDKNLKRHIKPLSKRHLEFFKLLQPVSFEFINGESGRTHIGFISQDVEKAMEKVGLSDLDFAGFCKDTMISVQTEVYVDDDGEEKERRVEVPVLDDDGNPSYIYSLRYDEFIALITHALQEVISNQEEMKKRMDLLEEKIVVLTGGM